MKAWRQARGLNRRRLSALLDVAESTVARWETGERQMPSRLIELALRGLEAELDERQKQPAGQA